MQKVSANDSFASSQEAFDDLLPCDSMENDNVSGSGGAAIGPADHHHFANFNFKLAISFAHRITIKGTLVLV